MIDILNTHRAEFNEIVAMCYEDQVDNFATTNPHSSSASTDKIDAVRLASYESLFDSIGVIRSVRCMGEEVELYAHNFGLSVSGWRKHYVYKPNNLADIRILSSLDDVDKIWEGQSGLVVAYREVDTGWYLIYIGN